ncbi:GDP-fucose protein O-fucosyltransferase, partial [Dissophora ornata]
DPSTKYLTFLPHSGFHNQRTELENALLLARLLNRTLIMPKVYLGPPMPWLRFKVLYSRLLYQTKIGLEHCQAIIENQEEEWSPLPTECLQYESWTMTDWDMFFDLNPLRHYVRILTRESMSMAYLANRGGDEGEEGKEKKTLLRSEGDVLFFDDNSLYDYHFTENATSKDSFRSKFRDEFTVEWLADRPERLIHLGSIFGTGRIYIESLESKAWLQMIRDHLILRTDILQKTSQRIADKISGGAGFVGVHIRISDGHFSLTARDTIENIRQELMWQIGITEDNGDNGEDEDEDESSPHFPSNASQAHKRQGRLSVEHPPKRRSNGRFTPIYLATDARRPRANPIFDKLFETFSCIFTLDDFEEDLELLHQFRNPEDGTLMAKFLIPMVDAMVAAKSAAFFGTPTSTFSNYIQKQLHPAFTGLYD